MEILLLQNTSENNKIGKTTKIVRIISGAQARDDCTVETPVLILNEDITTMTDVNYFYIPDFKRYYFKTAVSAMTGRRWMLTGTVDVLESFSDDILRLTVIADKQQAKSQSDLYINDGSFVTEDRYFNTIVNFSSGFDDAGHFILITAGG